MAHYKPQNYESQLFPEITGHSIPFFIRIVVFLGFVAFPTADYTVVYGITERIVLPVQIIGGAVFG
jgi:hypothetical protein